MALLAGNHVDGSIKYTHKQQKHDKHSAQPSKAIDKNGNKAFRIVGRDGCGKRCLERNGKLVDCEWQDSLRAIAHFHHYTHFDDVSTMETENILACYIYTDAPFVWVCQSFLRICYLI